MTHPLDDWIHARRLTDKEAAEAFGNVVRPSQINKLKRGICRPTIQTALAISRVTGISVDKLMGVE